MPFGAFWIFVFVLRELSTPSYCQTAIAGLQSGLLNSTIGCFHDGGIRDLPYVGPMGVSYMTLTYCSNYCYQQGYKYAGAESGAYCYCGNTYGMYGQATLSQCNINCSGDPTQSTKCGGNWKSNIMYTGFGSTHLTLLYRDTRLTNVNISCSSQKYSSVRCANRCLRRDSNGCTVLQYDANNWQCCLLVDRYSPLIGTTYSAGVSVWVVV